MHIKSVNKYYICMMGTQQFIKLFSLLFDIVVTTLQTERSAWLWTPERGSRRAPRRHCHPLVAWKAQRRHRGIPNYCCCCESPQHPPVRILPSLQRRKETPERPSGFPPNHTVNRGVIWEQTPDFLTSTQPPGPLTSTALQPELGPQREWTPVYRASALSLTWALWFRAALGVSICQNPVWQHERKHTARDTAHSKEEEQFGTSPLEFFRMTRKSGRLGAIPSIPEGRLTSPECPFLRQ